MEASLSRQYRQTALELAVSNECATPIENVQRYVLLEFAEFKVSDTATFLEESLRVQPLAPYQSDRTASSTRAASAA